MALNTKEHAEKLITSFSKHQSATFTLAGSLQTMQVKRPFPPVGCVRDRGQESGSMRSHWNRRRRGVDGRTLQTGTNQQLASGYLEGRIGLGRRPWIQKH
jgi:hypothetical protein